MRGAGIANGTGQDGPAARSLSHRDLQAALSFAGELASCSEEEELRHCIRGLRDLVGADAMIVGAVEADSDGPQISAEDEPEGWFDAAARDAFAHWCHQQPLVISHFGGLAPRAEKVSDHLSDREWRQREIYNDFYRRFGLDREIAVQIHASPDVVRCASLQRNGADFSERDRRLLDLIGPHLRAAYERLGERAALAGRIEMLERGLEPLGEGAVLLDHGGRAVAIGPRADRLLRRWFGPRDRAGLPEPVGEWLAGRCAGATERARGGRRLRMRLLAGDHEDLLLLREARADPLSAEALSARLPISAREAEVLACLAAGRGNAEIARDLEISRHTVARHLEHIYAKLGVQSRGSAVAAAFDSVAFGDG